ncbi:hypothetical protein ACM6RM_10655 [Streptomyces pratensis]
MAELFRHRDIGDPCDEVYILDVEEDAPDLGVYIGCHNPDAHVVVQVRAEKVDELIAALTTWAARRDGR